MMTCSRESTLESILNGAQEVMFQKNKNAGNIYLTFHSGN